MIFTISIFMPDFAGGKTILVDAYAAGRFAEWFVVQLR